jgi:acetylglutamate kinase
VSLTGLAPQVRQRTVAKARTLLEALPFMREHRGKVVVIEYWGAAMDESNLVRPFAEDVALLQHAGVVPVIVHGGGPAVTRVSERLGIETRFVDGIRVTDAETLDVATMVLAGKLNTEVVANLVTGGVRAVGLSGVDGGLLLARRQTSPDLGFVGEVVHVAADVVRTLTGAGFVPVVAGGMIPKLESAIRALKAGVGRVHLVDGRVEHSLVLELFTPEGIGTMVTPGP